MYMGIRKIKQALASRKILTGAQKLLRREANGLAFDFTDKSVKIIDATTQSNNRDTKGITDEYGNLTGPGSVLTYTSPSNKLCLQSDGYYKYGAHNVCAYSEDQSNTAWDALTANVTSRTYGSAGPSGALNATRIQTTSGWYMMSNATTNSGATYVVSAWVKSNTGSSQTFRVVANSGSDVTGDLTATTDWQQFSLTFTPTTSTQIGLRDSATPGGSTDLLVTQVHLYREPADTTYLTTTSAAVYSLPYTYDTSGTCEGLLVEEARTNLMTNSSDFTTWSQALCTATGSAAVGPTGLTDASSLIEDSSGGNHNLATTATIAASTTYTQSVFVKAGPGSARHVILIFLNSSFGTTAKVLYNTTTNQTSVASGTVDSHGAKDVGNGWWLVSATKAATSTGGATFYVRLYNGVSESYTGDGSSGVYLWNFSVEAGSFPTSPIVTYGSTATRAADNTKISDTSFPMDYADGTTYAQFTHKGGSTSAYGAVILGTANNSYFIAWLGSGNDITSNDVSSEVVLGGGSDVLATDTTYKVAIAYDSTLTERRSSVDGTTAATGAFDGSFTDGNVLTIGGRDGINMSTSIIKQVYWTPRIKSNAELQTDTT
jgi:hypothetical protein